MEPLLVVNVLVFIALLLLLSQLRRRLFHDKPAAHQKWSLAKKVLAGLVIGVLFGLGLQLVYGNKHPILKESMNWFNIVGNGYVQLLQIIVMPLIFVSILSAIAKLYDAASLGKISVLIITTLLFTTLIAALVGVLVTHLFALMAEGLTARTQEIAGLSVIESKYRDKVADWTVPQLILSFIPKNPFSDLTGTRPTSIVSIVIFAVFLVVASLELLRSNAEKGQRILVAIDALQSWVMHLVKLVMKLTPYGVLALMTNMVASSDIEDITKLGGFVFASYLGISIMFIFHALLLFISGVNPLRFFNTVWPVLTFAFTSRSSAASIPLSVEVQTRRLGISQSIASFSASFGASIGQNGCAGIYPAMLAVMVTPTVGINPLELKWIASLVFVVTISSIGVAGVGGRAIFAALIVLPALGFPVTLVALLITVEPLIDMGRTALNVNGAITAGVITSQLMKQTDKGIMNAEDDIRPLSKL